MAKRGGVSHNDTYAWSWHGNSLLGTFPDGPSLRRAACSAQARKNTALKPKSLFKPGTHASPHPPRACASNGIRGIAITVAMLAVACPPSSRAAGKSDTEAAETAKPPDQDPLGREAPRTMQIGLLEALAKGDMAQLAQYLEVKDPSSASSLKKARALSEALDRHGTMLARINLSLRPEGDLQDGLPPDEETIGSFDQDGQTIPVIARRVAGNNETPLWLISSDTLAKASDVIEEGAGKQSEQLAAPDESHNAVMLFGAPLKSWALLSGLGAALFSVIVLIFRALCHRMGLQRGSIEHHPFADIVFAIVPPGALMVVYGAIARLAEPLGAGLVERTALARYAGIVVWAAATWLGWRLVGVLGELAAWRFRTTGRVQWIGASNFFMRLLRVAMVVLAGAAMLATFGIDVTAGLAALGVGGLALALGSKTAVEDLVGSVVILADKPVRIGDTCKVNGRIGDVVDIGMRSTRIRTRERSILSIPNSSLADKEIENLTLRDHFHIEQEFGIPFDSSALDIEKVLETARKVLESDPDYIPSICPVRFEGFGKDSFRFLIRSNLKCSSHDEGYFRQERLLLELLKQLETAAIKIAVPTRSLEWQPAGKISAASREEPD